MSVSLDGRAVLEAEGDPLRASTAIGLGARERSPLDVRFEHAGPGPRLRLGLDAAGRATRDDPAALPRAAAARLACGG